MCESSPWQILLSPLLWLVSGFVVGQIVRLTVRRMVREELDRRASK
jgi:hypothetical protein